MIKSMTCVVTLNRKSSHYMFLSVCCIYQTNMNLMLSTAPSLSRSSSPLMVCSCIPPSGPPVSQRDLRCSPQIHQGLPRWGGELHAAASADVGARPASGRPAHLNPRQLGLHVKEGCRGQGGRRGRTVRRLTPGHRWGGRGEGRKWKVSRLWRKTDSVCSWDWNLISLLPDRSVELIQSAMESV